MGNSQVVGKGEGQSSSPFFRGLVSGNDVYALMRAVRPFSLSVSPGNEPDPPRLPGVQALHFDGPVNRDRADSEGL
jgi:hypothetical protein